MYDLGLCFKMAKLGRFGKVYERLDGGVVMDWIAQYDKQRDKSILRNAEDEHNRTKGDNSNRSCGWIDIKL